MNTGLAGSIDLVAPELRQGLATPSPACDMFAFGCLMLWVRYILQYHLEPDPYWFGRYIGYYSVEVGIFRANQSKSTKFGPDVAQGIGYSDDSARVPEPATVGVGTAASQSWGPIDFTIQDKNTPKINLL